MQDKIVSLMAQTLPVLPVIQVERAEDILPIGEALIEGGIHALEITLRTPAGLAAIELARRSLPEAIVCAGTVTTTEQMHAAIDKGAEFIVTPGITEKLLTEAVRKEIALIPGVASPSELMVAREFGLSFFNLFPASIVGGLGMLKAMAGPFPDLRFCPTGGLNAGNFMEYLSLDNVFCIGGSWMVVSEDGKFDASASTEAAREIAQALA